MKLSPEVPFVHIIRGLGGGQKSTFSECGHVAYQINGDNACSKMVGNIMPVDTYSTLGMMVSNSQMLFSESSYVALQIKGNRC